MIRKILPALLPVILSAIAVPALAAPAPEITGVAKVREGDTVVIGTTRIRLGGIDAPSVDQLCINAQGERWTCGVSARDELAKHVEGKAWTCHPRQIDRR